MIDEELNHSSQVHDNEITPESNKKETRSPQTTTSSVATASSQEVKHSLPRVKVIQQGNNIHIRLDCDDPRDGGELLIKALGAEDTDFLENMLGQLARDCLNDDNVVDEDMLNSMVSTIRGLKPKNQSHAVLAIQMSVQHDRAMTFGKHLKRATTLEEVNTYGSIFNKLTRSYAGHMEILQRCELGNEQKVTVQNVSVSEGGQAIVGNVTQNASDNDNVDVKAGSTLAAITDAHAVPMPSIEQSEQPVKVPAKRRRRP